MPSTLPFYVEGSFVSKDSLDTYFSILNSSADIHRDLVRQNSIRVQSRSMAIGPSSRPPPILLGVLMSQKNGGVAYPRVFRLGLPHTPRMGLLVSKDRINGYKQFYRESGAPDLDHAEAHRMAGSWRGGPGRIQDTHLKDMAFRGVAFNS